MSRQHLEGSSESPPLNLGAIDQAWLSASKVAPVAIETLLDLAPESDELEAGEPDLDAVAATPAERQEQYQQVLNWKASGNLEPLHGFDLSGQNLSEIDLSGADLRRSNLEGATLHRANLQGANLGETILSMAGMTEADLRKANFSDATMIEVDLHRAIWKALFWKMRTWRSLI